MWASLPHLEEMHVALRERDGDAFLVERELHLLSGVKLKGPVVADFAKRAW